MKSEKQVKCKKYSKQEKLVKETEKEGKEFNITMSRATTTVSFSNERTAESHYFG